MVPGEEIVACITPFLYHLLSLGLSRKTLRRHRDNLWRLGGELIRAVQNDVRLRKKPIQALLRATVGDDGGPLLHGVSSEEDQAAFDSTCRQLVRFLASHDHTMNPSR